MSGARCTRGLVCKVVRRNAHEHTGSAEAIRHSPRNGLTAYAALSSVTNSSCHRRRRISGSSKPGRASKNLRRLDTSNGCQDHTVLPYAASTTKDFNQPSAAVKILVKAFKRRSSGAPCPLTVKTALRSRPRARRCRVHRNPSQRS